MTNESPPKQTLQNMLSIYLNNLIGIDQTDVPEMEIRFGTARQMKPISRLEYDNVIKRLLSNQFELSVPQHLLRINTGIFASLIKLEIIFFFIIGIVLRYKASHTL